MRILKITLIIIAIFSSHKPANAEEQVSYKEFARIMKENTEYCKTKYGVIDQKNIKSGDTGLCIQHCEAFELVQETPGDGHIQPGASGKAMRDALAKCIKSHSKFKKLVDAAKTTRPSVAETLGLKNKATQGVIDRGFYQCMDNAAANRKHFSEEMCLCTATLIVNTINEQGGYGNISAAFTRIPAPCRG